MLQQVEVDHGGRPGDGRPPVGIVPRVRVRSRPAGSITWSWSEAVDPAGMRNPSAPTRSETARPVRDSRRPVGTRSCDHGTAAGSESGSSATRPNAAGSTASVVRKPPSPAAIRTTGLAALSGTRAARTR